MHSTSLKRCIIFCIHVVLVIRYLRYGHKQWKLDKHPRSRQRVIGSLFSSLKYWRWWFRHLLMIAIIPASTTVSNIKLERVSVCLDFSDFACVFAKILCRVTYLWTALLHQKSTLENHHLIQCMQILSLPECNILLNLDVSEKEALKVYIRHLILATDLSLHGMLPHPLFLYFLLECAVADYHVKQDFPCFTRPVQRQW